MAPLNCFAVRHPCSDGEDQFITYRNVPQIAEWILNLLKIEFLSAIGFPLLYACFGTTINGKFLLCLLLLIPYHSGQLNHFQCGKCHGKCRENVTLSNHIEYILRAFSIGRMFGKCQLALFGKMFGKCSENVRKMSTLLCWKMWKMLANVFNMIRHFP